MAWGMKIVGDHEKVMSYCSKVNERMKGDNFIENPFIGGCMIFLRQNSEEHFFIMKTKTIWSPLYLIGIVPIVLGIVLNVQWLLILGSIFLLTAFFWSPFFIVLVIRIKTKLKASVMSPFKTLDEVLEWDRLKCMSGLKSSE